MIVRINVGKSSWMSGIRNKYLDREEVTRSDDELLVLLKWENGTKKSASGIRMHLLYGSPLGVMDILRWR